MLLIITQFPFSAKKFSDHNPPPKKSEFRERQYLYSHEIKSIIRAAKSVSTTLINLLSSQWLC